MIVFQERIFTLEDIMEFLTENGDAYNTPTGNIVDKKTGKFRKATIEDFNTTVLVQFKDKYCSPTSSSSFINVTNFSFLYHNYKNLDIAWMRFLLTKHKEKYAPILKEHLEKHRKSVIKKVEEDVDAYKQKQMEKAQEKLYPHTLLEEDVEKVLSNSEIEL